MTVANECNPLHEPELTANQEAAILAMISEPTRAKAAARVGVDGATLWRWCQDPTFRRRLNAARTEMIEAAMRELQGAAMVAVGTLRTVAGDDTAPHAARVGAARTIIELAIKGHELLDINDRINQLEERTFS